MPPFHSKSTGALRIAEISSLGVMVARSSRSICRAASLSVSDFALRSKTPPPGEIRLAS